MNYSSIKYNDIANGPGVRISLFVSGCTNQCEGCFNKVTWDFNSGQPFTAETEDEIIKNIADKRYQGITLLGGEPFEIQNQKGLVTFIKRLKDLYPDKNVWAYTGFLYDKDLGPNGKRYCEVTEELLSYIDVLVDGKFDKSKYDISLIFRGSYNQRIIDLKKSTYDNIVLKEEYYNY